MEHLGDEVSTNKDEEHVVKCVCVLIRTRRILSKNINYKNDRRNSGGTLRQKFNLIDF